VAIDDPFPYDFEDLVERALRPYRPILSYVAIAQFRTHLDLFFRTTENLAPWIDALDRAAWVPPTSAAGLTSAQLALLRSGRPTRVLETLAENLEIRLDGGSEESERKARELLLLASGCLDDLAPSSPVLPEPDLDACARELGRFIDLAIVALHVSTVAELSALHQRRDPSDAGSDNFLAASRYFSWVLLAFRRVKLSEEDASVFLTYYVRRSAPEDVAERRGHAIDVEIQRRQAFLERFGQELRREIERLTREVSPDPARADLRSSPWLRTLLMREALGAPGTPEKS
jgi:hypothetical protein